MTGEGSLFDVPPAAIGRFRVLHQLGAGTCGPVFRAVDPESDTTVAVKLFNVGLPPGRLGALAEGLSRLVSELPRMTGVVTPLAAGLHGHTPYLATSYAAGDSLDVALKQFGPAVLADVVPRLRVLASALDAAAERDVVHGAMHPRDVIVSDAETTLTGLGVWPLLADMGERLPIRRPYRAPDLGPTASTAAGDRFSLAALTYEWLTGRRPASAFVPGDMAAVSGGDRAALALVFGRALHADPDRRYESCTTFVEQIATLVDETDAAADVPPAPPPRRRRGAPEAVLPLHDFPEEVADAPVGLSDLGGEDAESPEDAEDGDAGAGLLQLAETSPPEPEDLSRIDELPADVPLEVEAAEPDHTDAVNSPWLLDAAGESTAARPTRSWWLAWAVLLGIVVGVAGGYLLWGRRPVDAVPAGATELERPAPVEIEDPQPIPTDPSAPSRPAAAPPPPAPPAAAAPVPGPAGTPPRVAGSLLVRSTPAGATVFVDDERRGVTPITLQDVTLGTRVVRVQRDGYVADERRVTLTSDRPARSVEVRLRRAPAPTAGRPSPPAARTGSLVVDSRPRGAAVTVDGRPVGTTPVTLNEIAVGTHRVTMVLQGFRPVVTTVEVAGGEQARAAASLTSVQEPR